MSSPFQEVKVRNSSFLMVLKLPSRTERKIAAHKRECSCLAFNPIGDVIATGGGDNLVKLWNANTGKEL